MVSGFAMKPNPGMVEREVLVIRIVRRVLKTGRLVNTRCKYLWALSGKLQDALALWEIRQPQPLPVRLRLR